MTTIKILFLSIIFLNFKSSHLKKVRNDNCACGETIHDITGAEAKARIIGGTTTKPNSHPWQAFIKAADIYCGGTVINDRYVLTAAHCTMEDPEDYKVYLGLHDNLDIKLPRVEMYTVIEFKTHVNATRQDFHTLRDIALLRLNRPITFNAFIMPICLAEKGVNYQWERVTIMGWGSTSFENQVLTQYLLQARLTVMSQEECVDSQLGGHILEDDKYSVMCAYGVGRDACLGDSGGPVIFKKPNGKSIEIGIVSYGEDCGLYPTIYVNVSSYLDWIYEETKDAFYCPF